MVLLVPANCVGAYEDQFDVAMLITGDTDYVPAVDAVRRRNKRVIWCHFDTQTRSRELRQVCDGARLLDEPPAPHLPARTARRPPLVRS
ncbi:MAG: NYN domain-containing protein [Gemmatimonadaceae bacterium]